MSTTIPDSQPRLAGPSVQVGSRNLESRQLFTALEIQKRVQELALALEAFYSPSEELTVLICLDGAFVFAADLVRQINRTTRIETVKIKSYEGTKSSGAIKTAMPVTASLSGRHIIIVEDIIDSGRTLLHLLRAVSEQNPASIRTVALLDKPASHEVEINADLVGFSIGPRFVVGYGLDVDGRYRNLPFIAEVFEPE